LFDLADSDVIGFTAYLNVEQGESAMNRSVSAALVLTLFMSMSAGAETAQQSALNPVKAEAAKQYPRIVLFSTSWCPHCRAAKEYMTKNNIPFINRDVEVDDGAMEDLTKKYKSAGVPVIVFGKDSGEIIIKGFSPGLFQETLQKARMK
jgi:glutaredoxin